MKQTLFKLLVVLSLVMPLRGETPNLQTSILESDMPNGFGSALGRFGDESQAEVEGLLPLYYSQQSHFFADFQSKLDSGGEEVFSTGLGYRHAVGNVVLGINAFWDWIDSKNGNTFHSLGLGAEVLAGRWEARANFYIPDGRNVQTDQHRLGMIGIDGEYLVARSVEITRYESALDGYDIEAGILLPWVDRWIDIKALGGFYHYGGGVGEDYDGYTARIEARPVEALSAEIKYVSDQEIGGGGNWTGAIKVTVPFEIGAVFEGKNPFAGIGDTFKRRRAPSVGQQLSAPIVRGPQTRVLEGQRVKVREARWQLPPVVVIAPDPDPDPDPDPVPFTGSNIFFNTSEGPLSNAEFQTVSLADWRSVFGVPIYSPPNVFFGGSYEWIGPFGEPFDTVLGAFSTSFGLSEATGNFADYYPDYDPADAEPFEVQDVWAEFLPFLL